MPKKLLDDCFLHDRDRLRHDDAIALLKARINPVTESETIELNGAAGRILAQSVIAGNPVPAHTNAAVDGYAFAAADYDREQGSVLPVSGRSAAGHALDEPTQPRCAVRIFTGAVLPSGHDCVVMQEDTGQVVIDGRSHVRIPAGVKPGANIRKAGEDVKPGEQVFSPGHLLRPQDLAALASLGLQDVSCFRALRAAIVSSGDEVIRPGSQNLAEGQVFDANAPMLLALAKLAGAEVTDLGVWPDNAGEVRRRLITAAREFDLILTTGGASRGEEDHMTAALDAAGTRHFWQLAVKPGRPMMFGQIGDTIVAGLPGNPVAAFVCFLMYVYPMLRRLAGGPWLEPRRFQLPAAFSIPERKTGRREFWRGTVKVQHQEMVVGKFGRDGSGLISGLRAANALIDIPEDVPAIAEGDLVGVIPFSEFGILTL